MLTSTPHRPRPNGALVFGQPRSLARRIAMLPRKYAKEIIAVAAMAMIPAPENWMNGTAASTAIVMQVHTGVCRLGDTFDSGLEKGNWLLRDMPKQSRIVEAMIDRQQTKMAAETTSR